MPQETSRPEVTEKRKERKRTTSTLFIRHLFTASLQAIRMSLDSNYRTIRFLCTVNAKWFGLVKLEVLQSSCLWKRDSDDFTTCTWDIMGCMQCGTGMYAANFRCSCTITTSATSLSIQTANLFSHIQRARYTTQTSPLAVDCLGIALCHDPWAWFTVIKLVKYHHFWNRHVITYNIYLQHRNLGPLSVIWLIQLQKLGEQHEIFH